jgi:hypothetical protein
MLRELFGVPLAAPVNQIDVKNGRHADHQEKHG